MAVKPGRRPNEDKPTEVVNPLLIITRKLEELTAENNNLKNQFNGLITQLDKKFSQEEEVKQAQLELMLITLSGLSLIRIPGLT